MQKDVLPTESPIVEIPLSTLALAPENARKTPPDPLAQEELKASIAAHGLLENLIARPMDDGGESEGFAVVAGGRRLAALQALADDGLIPGDHPVPCRVVLNGNGGEISLAENAVRLAMHPADQVEAFAALAKAGLSVSGIAARFGVSERTVEQRLRLGNAAPELLEAYRAGDMGLDALKAFAVTTDQARQLSVWEQLSQQPYGPSFWQIKRLLTGERVPAASALARYVGVEDYEAAGGAVMRDLFADEEEDGVWLEDAALLESLAQKKLNAAADELSTRWKWAEAHLEVDWSDIARFGRIQPAPGQPTSEETAERERLYARQDELVNLDEDDWTEALAVESEAIQSRLAEINQNIAARECFSREDFLVAGCIATVCQEGKLELFQGLVKPEDMPKPDPAEVGANGKSVGAGVQSPDSMPNSGAGVDATADAAQIQGPTVTPPQAQPVDPAAKARDEAGVSIGLADDLRAIRTALVKTQLANDFEAAFDLMVFQLVRSVFGQRFAESQHALDIQCRETADRPRSRMNDADFAAWNPGEAMLADWSDLPLEWMEKENDMACFGAMSGLTRKEKEKLFSAAVARTLQGQLAFEHGARPEIESTVARLGIDFAQKVRPTAGLFWSRLRKDRMLDIAREHFGPAWVQARSKYKKADLANAMEEAFAAGPVPVGVDADTHAAALAWILPGFGPFSRAGNSGQGPADGEAQRSTEAVDAGDGDATSTTDQNQKTEQGESPQDGASGEPDGNADGAYRTADDSPADSRRRKNGATPVNGGGDEDRDKTEPLNETAGQMNGNGSEPHSAAFSTIDVDADIGTDADAGADADPTAPALNGGPPVGHGVSSAAESTDIPAFLRNLA